MDSHGRMNADVQRRKRSATLTFVLVAIVGSLVFGSRQRAQHDEVTAHLQIWTTIQGSNANEFDEFIPEGALTSNPAVTRALIPALSHPDFLNAVAHRPDVVDVQSKYLSQDSDGWDRAGFAANATASGEIITLKFTGPRGSAADASVLLTATIEEFQRWAKEGRLPGPDPSPTIRLIQPPTVERR